MVADILTKALPHEAFKKFHEAFGVIKIFHWVKVLKDVTWGWFVSQMATYLFVIALSLAVLKSVWSDLE